MSPAGHDFRSAATFPILFIADNRMHDACADDDFRRTSGPAVAEGPRGALRQLKLCDAKLGLLVIESQKD